MRALLAGALALLALAAPATAQTCNGYADLCARPFDETVLAGTHNSMAADDYDWNFAVTTQTLTMRRQLDAGIRALSLDVHYARPGLFGIVDNADGPTGGGVEPYLCHNICLLGSIRLTTGFNEIAGFLRDHPREVIAIYVEDYVTPDDLAASLRASDLWPYVYEGPLTRTLGEMIALNRRVVMIAQNRASGYAWYPKLTTIGRDTSYDFSRTEQLTDPAGLWDSCRPTPWGAAGRGRILVMPHFVTPTTTGSRDASAAVNARTVLVQRALKCRQRHGVMPSIVLVDYHELGDVLGAVRALNDLYVAPVACAGGVCGVDPGSSDAGVTPDPGCEGCTPAVASSGSAVLRRLRIASAARRVTPGSAIRVRVSIANGGRAHATVPVAITASRARGVRYPATLDLDVPSRSTATRAFTVRIARSARAGRLVLIATVDGLEARLVVRVSG